MTTTALRAALARIDWPTVGHRTITGLQLCWLVAQLLAAALAIAIAWIREHRAELRAALVATIAAVIVAAHLTHAAGRSTRRWLEQLNARAAALLEQLHPTPVPVTDPTDEQLLATVDAVSVTLPPLPKDQAEAHGRIDYDIAWRIAMARAVLARWGGQVARPAAGEVQP